MKRTIAILSLAVMALTASPALAKKSGDMERKEEQKESNLKGFAFGNSKFVVVGSLKSKTETSITVTLKAGAHLKGLAGQDVVVAVNGDTKYSLPGETDTLAALVVGSQIMVKGDMETVVQNNTISDSNNVTASIKITAKSVKVMGDDELAHERAEKPKAAVGEVTTKTDTSITIKNSLTGESKTLTVSPETTVKVNGEVKALSDVKVGDKGWVKFKTSVSGMFAKMINIFR